MITSLLSLALVLALVGLGYLIGSLKPNLPPRKAPIHKTYQEGLFDKSDSLCENCALAMNLVQRYPEKDVEVNYCKVPLYGVMQSMMPTKVIRCSEYKKPRG